VGREGRESLTIQWKNRVASGERVHKKDKTKKKKKKKKKKTNLNPKKTRSTESKKGQNKLSMAKRRRKFRERGAIGRHTRGRRGEYTSYN